MRDDAAFNTLPLSQAVWNAWLDKNRRKEARLNARLLKMLVALAVGGLVLSFVWLAHSRFGQGTPSKPLVPTSSGILLSALPGASYAMPDSFVQARM